MKNFFKSKTYMSTVKPGRCGGCGISTKRYNTKYKMWVCEKCNAEEIVEKIALHVMYPNQF